MNALKRARMLRPVPFKCSATNFLRLDPYSISDLQIPPIKNMIQATTIYGMQPGMMPMSYQAQPMVQGYNMRDFSTGFENPNGKSALCGFSPPIAAIQEMTAMKVIGLPFQIRH